MTGSTGAAVVGIGATRFCRRGESYPKTQLELACQAILLALDDAGLSIKDVDGFAYYNGGYDTGMFAQTLGIPEIRFSAAITGGGSGAPGSIGLASAAVATGQADVVVTVTALQQGARSRHGAAFANKEGPSARPSTPESDFMAPYGAFAPGQLFAMLTQRHMHLYGTTRLHLAEVCISQRANAVRRPTSLRRSPLTIDDYLNARMISDPLCLLDYTMEGDGAAAVITTSAERAKDLRRPPVYVDAWAAGGDGRWGTGISWMGMPDDLFPTAGAGAVAEVLYRRAGLRPADIDVALLYDHFSPMVLMQLEDYGFCGRGEAGPFVAEGNIRWPHGRIPVNTHGGNLSDAFLAGMTHIVEAVEQLRGTAVNQVRDAEIALVTGGPSYIPLSGLVLRR